MKPCDLDTFAKIDARWSFAERKLLFDRGRGADSGDLTPYDAINERRR
jgi:hypothetical protein